MLDLAKRSDTAIYTIALKSSSPNERAVKEAEFALRQLAQETGGQAFFPMEIGQLAGVYRSIAHELASQYALGYTPKIVRNDGVFRRIVVRVTDRPDVRVRTRSGYIPERRAGGAALE